MFCVRCAQSKGWAPTWNVKLGSCAYCKRMAHCTTDEPVFVSAVKEVVPSTMAENIKAIDSWNNKVAS